MPALHRPPAFKRFDKPAKALVFYPFSSSISIRINPVSAAPIAKFKMRLPTKTASVSPGSNAFLIISPMWAISN
jgi:hypothetical protein